MATPTPSSVPALERPTDRFRQVLVEEREPCAHGGDPSWAKVRFRYLKMQRQWLVFDGVAPDTMLFMGSHDGTTLNGVKGRPVWRDLPVVTEAQASTEEVSS